MRSNCRGTSSPGEQLAPRRSCLLSSWRGGASGIYFPSYQNLHPKRRVILSTLFFSDFWKYPLSFTCIFTIAFITLQTLCMSLHYVPLITHTFTTYIFIMFYFHLFPRKIVHFPYSQWQLFMHRPPCACQNSLYWSHLNHMTSPWRITIPSL